MVGSLRGELPSWYACRKHVRGARDGLSSLGEGGRGDGSEPGNRPGDKGVASTIAGAVGGQADAIAKQAAASMLTGRFTRPEEVAQLVLTLASDRTGNVVGADFVIDGGLITTL